MRFAVLMFLLASVPPALIASSPPAEASGYCPGQKSGKCPQKKKTPGKSRDDFTAAQREKLMERARDICKKRYGSTSRVYKIDYRKWMVFCTEPGY